MIYKLGKNTTSKLLALPESGIGYQIVNAKIMGNSEEKCYVVFNSEIAIKYDEKLERYSNTLIGKGYNLLLRVLQTIEFDEFYLVKRDENNYKTWNRSAINIEENIHKIEPHDIYIRPSVYERDNRLDLNKKVLFPGSYVTTLESYTDCHIMREDPFEKYSLPVQQEFVKVYYIKHTGEKNITNGIFEGSFGKKGGGIKLSFNDYGKLLI